MILGTRHNTEETAAGPLVEHVVVPVSGPVGLCFRHVIEFVAMDLSRARAKLSMRNAVRNVRITSFTTGRSTSVHRLSQLFAWA